MKVKFSDIYFDNQGEIWSIHPPLARQQKYGREYEFKVLLYGKIRNFCFGGKNTQRKVHLDADADIPHISL